MISVILLCGGSGTRFGEDKMKSLLGGKPVFLWSLEKFQNHPEVDEIVIVARQDEISEYLLLKDKYSKISEVTNGGKERQDSVTNGIAKVKGEITLVHNGANPLVTDQEISEIIKATKEFGASVVGSKAKNTIKKVDDQGIVLTTVPRQYLREVQTPQGVNTKKFKELLKEFKSESVTDDVSYFEKAGLPAKIVHASENNFKVTTKEDLEKMNGIISQNILIGFGHDSHRFAPGKDYITLGGIQIPCDEGFSANSDGDVLIHAICNSIGTAIGQGSISLYADEMCLKNGITDSKEYLKHIVNEMKKMGYGIGNIACSIEAKKPKLEKHIPEMKKVLSKVLECTPLQIGIACTSGEDLSDFGKGLGIQVFVNLILIKRE